MSNRNKVDTERDLVIDIPYAADYRIDVITEHLLKALAVTSGSEVRRSIIQNPRRVRFLLRVK